MKKIITILLVFAFINTQAQYQKASFLNKDGRYYELGTTTRLLGNGNSSALGIYISLGREKPNKRFFTWYELEYVKGSRFSYSSPAISSTPIILPGNTVMVSGKGASNLTLRYNLGFYLLDKSKSENKFLPFINLSFGGIVASGDIKDYKLLSINGSAPSKNVLPEKTGIFLRGGGGLTYRLNENLGFKFLVAYNFVVTETYISKLTGDESLTNNFNTLPNHIAIGIGMRWLLKGEND